MIPKYFKNLHLMISTITGTPRIVNIDTNKTNFSEKYKDIPKEEWESAIIQYFNHFKNGTRQLYVIEDWSFFIGGKAKNKEQLIKILENILKEVKTLKE